MRAPCLCFLDRVAHHHEGSGQDLEMVGITPDRAHAALHIRIEGLAALDRLLRAEDHLGRFRRELPAGLGSAGLHDHRPALDRPRDVWWSPNRHMRPQIGQDSCWERVCPDGSLWVVAVSYNKKKK